MKRVTVLLCFFTLISCQDKVICPAYQSTYILDDTTRNTYFSYLWQLDENTRSQYLAQQQATDSTFRDSVNTISQPKTDYYAYVGEHNVPWRIQNKSKYGIIKPAFYPIKSYQMRTAPMENLLGPEPLSNDFSQQEFGIDSLQSDPLNSVAMDSLGVDSLAVARTVAEPQKEGKDEARFLYGYDPSDNFNVEQLYYNKYFADRLIDTKPRPEPKRAGIMDQQSTNPQSDSTATDKGAGLKGLFKRKNRANTESSDLEEEAMEDDQSESSSAQEPQSEQTDGDGGGS